MSDLVIYSKETQTLPSLAFLKNVKNQVRISEIKNRETFGNELGKILVKVIYLLGIKNPVSDIDKQDISEMILMAFKQLSLDEVDYAFKLERYGIYDSKTSHFQQFNANYVSEILNKYLNWKKNKLKNNNLNEKENINMVIDEEENKKIMDGACERLKNEIKEQGFISSAYVHVYNYLNNIKKLPTDDNYKSNILKKAKIIAINEVKSRDDRRGTKKLIQNIKDGFERNKVAIIAKRLVLEDYFNKQIRIEKL